MTCPGSPPIHAEGAGRSADGSHEPRGVQVRVDGATRSPDHDDDESRDAGNLGGRVRPEPRGRRRPVELASWDGPRHDGRDGLHAVWAQGDGPVCVGLVVAGPCRLREVGPRCSPGVDDRIAAQGRRRVQQDYCDDLLVGFRVRCHRPVSFGPAMNLWCHEPWCMLANRSQTVFRDPAAKPYDLSDRSGYDQTAHGRGLGFAQ